MYVNIKQREIRAMLSETILNEHSLFMDRVGLVLQWRRDIERWEYKKDKERLFRERNVQYCKDHLSVSGSISQDDLCLICSIVNDIFERAGLKIRVVDSMGEFIPATIKGD